MQMFNLMKDPHDMRDHAVLTRMPYKTQYELIKSLPVFIDYTEEMTPVKNQGKLGSCVAFALTALKEWQETKEHKAEVAAGKKDHRHGKPYDLSEQWLYYKCKEIDPWPNIEGTSIRYGLKVLQKLGTPTEGAWEYNDEFKGSPESWATLIARWTRIGEYTRINNLLELKAALTRSPVVIGIGCYEEMFKPTPDGYVQYPSNSKYCLGGHAVCIVGYDDKTRRVKFKNSWSANWGDKGYGYLDYRYIQDFMWDAWTCFDLSVTKDMLKN